MTPSLTTSETAAPVTEEVSETKLGKLKDLLTPVLRRNLKTEGQAQALIEAPSFVSGFDLLVKGLIAKLANVFRVTVDYSRDLAAMVKAGSYGSVNSDITAEHFPVKGEGKVDAEIILVHFDKDISSDDALTELDALGLRAARIEELLAFGETHPDVQRGFPIVALGSVWRDRHGYRLVAYLGGWYGKRSLYLFWFEVDWFAYYRFAVVRK